MSVGGWLGFSSAITRVPDKDYVQQLQNNAMTEPGADTKSWIKED